MKLYRQKMAGSSSNNFERPVIDNTLTKMGVRKPSYGTSNLLKNIGVNQPNINHGQINNLNAGTQIKMGNTKIKRGIKPMSINQLNSISETSSQRVVMKSRSEIQSNNSRIIKKQMEILDFKKTREQEIREIKLREQENQRRIELGKKNELHEKQKSSSIVKLGSIKGSSNILNVNIGKVNPNDRLKDVNRPQYNFKSGYSEETSKPITDQKQIKIPKIETPKDYSIRVVDIFSNALIKNMTHVFSKKLIELGIQTNLHFREINNDDINRCEKDNNRYLLLFNSQFLYDSSLKYKSGLKALPKNKYIIYQIEQLNQNQHFYQSVNFMADMLNNAYAILDYSKTNISYYPSHIQNRVTIVKPIIKTLGGVSQETPKPIDILFVGKVNDRRRIILDKLKEYNNKLDEGERLNIEIVENKYGDELIEIIKKSRILFNIHAFPNAILEIFRIHDVIAHDIRIISEKPEDGDIENLVERYKSYIEFIDPLNKNNVDSRLESLFQQFSKKNELHRENKNKMEFIERLNNENKVSIQINLYQNLFHKYMLGLANINDKIKYEIVINNSSKEFKERKYYAHLHCYDISRFDEMYGEYIDKISQYFSVVITYSIGINTINNEKFVILKIPNKGMDIGGKFCATTYLNDNKISYEYILFLHSKSNPDTRKKYFEPLINYLDDEFIENINDYDGYFPDIQWEIVGDKLKMISGNPQFAHTNWPERNLMYRNELLKYLNCKNNTNRFIEGNVYILSKNVINKLYTGPLLYNILNTQTSFDYQWVQGWGHKLKGHFSEVYKQFQERKLAPRNERSFDGYFEHVFERVVLNFCNNYRILNVNSINIIGLKNINVSIADNLVLLKNYLNKLNKNSKIYIYDISEIEKINYNIKTIFCIQPFEIRSLVPFLSNFKIKPEILWVWEFKSLPQIFKDYEKYFSKVYVPSQFCYDIFSNYLSITIEKIDLKSMIHDYIDKIPDYKIKNQKINNILENPKNKTIYGFCFDLNSSIVRKNPLNLVRAFNNLNDETKVLILKYRHPRGNNFINKIEYDIYNSFIIEVKKNKNIYCITDELEQLDLYKLYTIFDYYISPHCGEGFGLTIYDNMILGNKIISPYYSGETEYLKREDIIRLEYEEKQISGLKEHPIYGQMKDFKGAYISVESIMRGLNNIIGDEIYILGNGPSLKNCDFNFLKYKTTFALNSSYKKFAELDFYPTYFGCFDPKLIECHYDKFVQLMNDNNKIKKFFFLNENNKGQKQFSFQDENNSRYQKINFLPPQESYINKSSFNKFYKMHNSGATAALISILLGYKNIILLGCDGNYVEQIPETRLIDASTKTLQILETPEKNPNYWFDNYQEKGEIYSVPDGNSCHMKGWELLYQASKIHNVEIINENPESKIPYFVNLHMYNVTNFSDITIIIPTLLLNRDKFNTMNTIHNELYKLFKKNNYIFRVLYVIDNNSNIDEYDFLKKIPYIGFIKMSINKERIFCRNITGEKVNSKYIIFNDFDDSIDNINSFYEHFQFVIKNNYNVAVSNYKIRKDKNKYSTNKCNNTISLNNYNHTHIGTIIMKKSFFINNKFINNFGRNINNNIWAGEDDLWFYNIVKKELIIYSSGECFYVYYICSGTSWNNRILSLYERYENNNKNIENTFCKNYLNDFINSFNWNITSVNILLNLKRYKLINKINLLKNSLEYENIFLYSIVLKGNNINYILKFLSWYLDYYCSTNNSCIIVFIDSIDLKNKLFEDFSISQKTISNKIYILNVIDEIKFQTNNLILLKDLNIQNEVENFIKKNIKYMNIKTYNINKNNQFCGSFFLKASSELLPKNYLLKINEKSKINLIKLTKLNYKNSNIMFTGPSINNNLLIKNKEKFVDSYNIAINSFIKSEKYCNICNPNIVIFSDPVFHSSPSNYTNKFYKDLNKLISNKNDIFILAPIRDYYIIEKNIINNKNIIYLHFSDNTDLEKLYVKITSNVATGFAFPLIDFLNTKKNYLYGFTGKSNIEDETYFWEHNDEIQYVKEKEELIKIFPGFFNISYKQYNEKHLENTNNYLKKNKDKIEIIGKTYYKYL